MVRTKRRLLAVAVCSAAAGTAHAQTIAGGVTGGVDPQTGLKNIVSYLLVLAGTLILGICGYKGVHAFAESRSLGPILLGGACGMALCFGGAYILQKYGVTGF